MALADLAAEQNLLDSVGRDLTTFVEVFQTTPGLAMLLTSPTAARKDQQAVVESFIGQAEPAPVTRNFLKLLVAKRRMALIEEIVAAFNRDVERRSGRITVAVQTPKPLNKAHIKRLEEILAQGTGRAVTLEVAEEPALLGGMVVRIGSVMLDYSVRCQLQRLKAHMMG
ncbi:MAG: ATP synthase F1 subunit delta [Magnetococcales bacterium]|nr:ATP synthase F1 subunit delta [Magnetococcales bacterium]